MNRFFSSDTHMGNRNEMSHRYTRIDDFYGSARNLHLIAEVFQGMVFIDELSLQFQRAMDIHRFELPTDTVDAAAYDAQDVQIPLVFGLSDNRWLDARVVGTPALAL